jgi:hypothetical protein
VDFVSGLLQWANYVLSVLTVFELLPSTQLGRVGNASF